MLRNRLLMMMMMTGAAAIVLAMRMSLTGKLSPDPPVMFDLPTVATVYPSMAPTTLICLCLARRAPKLSRIIPDWPRTCRNSTAIPAELLEDDTLHPFDQLLVTNSIAMQEMQVFYMLGGDWGQLCNKMGIFAAMHRWVEKQVQLVPGGRLSNAIIAVPSVFSQTYWSLDLTSLSRRVFGVLMDCEECLPQADGRDEPKLLRCSSIVVKGKLYDVSNSWVFDVFKEQWVGNLYHQMRPKSLGFMHEINALLQPQRALKFLVNQAMIKSSTASPSVTLGIHQRYMDGMCFKWLMQRGQYNCHPRANFANEIAAMSRHFNSLSGRDYFWNDSRRGREGYMLQRISTEQRRGFEQTYPLFITCNYSLSATQVHILQHEWPLLFNTTLSRILLATDGRTPASEREMLDNWLGGIFRLSESEPCFARFKHHSMLADMLALSMADLHMGNPLSSCDDIVVHWRKQRNKSVGTSYPQRCYDEYYK